CRTSFPDVTFVSRSDLRDVRKLL
ncbi:hypothetical protein JTE90_021123, partial [Oedothorax gibbosus]